MRNIKISKNTATGLARHKAMLPNLRQCGRNGIDVHDLKGGKGTGKIDLYKKPNGDIVIKPKGGSGEGEPTGHNIKELN